MRRAASILVAFVMLSVGTACTTMPQVDNPRPPAAAPPWHGNRPALCIALSGGGIRSGAVSLGVLQALQERNALASTDIVSVVSGGGYPLYGLLLRAERHPNLTLDELLSDDHAYIKSVEQNSTFITHADAFMTAILAGAGSLDFPFRWMSTPNRVEPAAGTYPYALKIHRTFVGFQPAVDRGTGLSRYRDVRQRIGLPYFIFQASASPGMYPVPSTYQYSADEVFELSTDWIGSRRSQYWETYIADLRLLDAAVASAAALDSPRKSKNDVGVPDWAKRVGFGLGVGMRLQDGSGVFLSDGGFTDNQATTSLLDRHCEEILALDASHDPGATFDGWARLIETLSTRGWKSTPISHQGNESTIPTGNAWNLPEHTYSFSTTSPEGRTSNVTILKLGIAPSLYAHYPRSVMSFWEQELANWESQPSCSGIRLSEKCAFPQQSTAQQSYSKEEFRAYRCLGHFMASREMTSRATMATHLLATGCMDKGPAATGL